MINTNIYVNPAEDRASGCMEGGFAAGHGAYAATRHKSFAACYGV